MSHLIELKKVSKFYAGKDTVSTGFARVDLALDSGEFVAITGESGSGKSTLINVLSGLDTYEEGVMLVNGEDTSGYVTRDYERYRKEFIGNIFQDYNLIGSYTVYQNIELAMLLAGKKAKECKARIRELIELVDLAKYTNVKVSKLSGGQKQRVAIARVLSKDAPVIIADEPTGNLDSESAAKVMETLGKISKDKLVVVVTHNYEQVEPYVTRKITMYDGRIIEDKKLTPERSMDSASLYNSLAELAANHPESFGGQEADRQEVLESAKHLRKEIKSGKNRFTAPSAGTQLRLGLRNTFNLPAKFLLLLLVYVFVSTAVLSQYGSTKSSLYEAESLGYNWYFTDTNAKRVIITREDNKAFSDADEDAIRSIGNIESIVRNDILIDATSRLRNDECDMSGPTLPIDQFDESKLTYGKMPENDYEIVVACDENSFEYNTIKEAGESYIGKSYWLDSDGNSSLEWGTKVLSHKVTISGIALVKSEDPNSFGGMKLYLSDTALNRILTKNMAAMSNTRVTCNDKRVDTSDYQVVYTSAKVPKGEVYIFEDYAYQFHDEGKISGKDMTVRVSNANFISRVNLKVGAIVKESNIESLLDIEKKNYDNVCGRIYLNKADYDKLFDKGSYQMSVYIEDAHQLKETVGKLKDAGYTTYVMKDSLATSGSPFLKLFSVCLFAGEVVLLFFIAYAVIRLIMRSRNTYYSTLRILGANKKHTDNILRIELCAMMTISYGIVLVFVAAVKRGIMSVPQVEDVIGYLKLMDYGVLLGALLVMSLLIANRYSRALFKKSAMNVYREEA